MRVMSLAVWAPGLKKMAFIEKFYKKLTISM